MLLADLLQMEQMEHAKNVIHWMAPVCECVCGHQEFTKL